MRSDKSKVIVENVRFLGVLVKNELIVRTVRTFAITTTERVMTVKE